MEGLKILRWFPKSQQLEKVDDVEKVNNTGNMDKIDNIYKQSLKKLQCPKLYEREMALWYFWLFSNSLIHPSV